MCDVLNSLNKRIIKASFYQNGYVNLINKTLNQEFLI